jgi:fructan beta-fructosidase
VAFYTSPDLKKWEFQSRIGDFFECPDLYALPVDGDANKVKWVLAAADGRYLLGQFDGKKFVKESDKHQVWYGNFYAAQTFDSAPDGHRVQIGWGNGITFPGMPFNQQMTVPVELTLRTTDDGIRLVAEPVKEIESLRDGKHAWKDVVLKPGTNPLAEVKGELFDISAEVRPGVAEAVTFTLRGVPVVYDVKKGEVSCRGKADRGSVEVFGNGGQTALSVGVLLSPDDRSLALSARGGEAAVTALEVNLLKSAWK